MPTYGRTLSNYRIDAFIAGAEKSGTTSLGFYVSQHPRIRSHFHWSEDSSERILEFGAFLDDRWRDENYFAGEYLAAFKRFPDADQIVIAKNVGIMHSDGAAQNLKEYSPRCKLIVSLRNPVDRAYSSFWYQRYRGEEPLERFEDAIDLEQRCGSHDDLSRHRQYLAKGRYFEQLKTLVELFGKANVHVILVEDLKNSPDETLNNVFSFLDLPVWKVDAEIVRNTAKGVRSPAIAQLMARDSLLKTLGRQVLTRRYRRKLIEWLRLRNSFAARPAEMNAETRTMLCDYFRPHNALLEGMLGRDLSHWSK